MDGTTQVRKLEVGAPVPDFELPATGGQKVRLSDYRDRSNVLLVFYPADFSPVCSNQLPAIEADRPRFEALGAAILGISVDGRWAHEAFAREVGLNFPLLADVHRDVSRAYGVLREKDNFSERALFVVDRKGVLRYRLVHEIREIPPLEEALRVLQSLA